MLPPSSDTCALYNVDYGGGDVTSIASSSYEKCKTALIAHATADTMTYGMFFQFVKDLCRCSKISVIHSSFTAHWLVYFDF